MIVAKIILHTKEGSLSKGKIILTLTQLDDLLIMINKNVNKERNFIFKNMF